MQRAALVAALLALSAPASHADENRDALVGQPTVRPRAPAPPAAPATAAVQRRAEQVAFWRNLFWVAIGATAAVVVMRLGRR